MKIQHILVTTDLSKEALRPWGPVSDLARTFGARVTVLHVVENLAGIQHGAPLAPALPEPDVDRRLQEARSELEEQRSLFSSELAVETDVVTGTDVAEAIAEYAKSHGADLVALSTHGRTGFRHLVLGSVAEALLRRSPVPVLVFTRPRD